ncbi:MAG: hypothetical protein B6I20_12995 [Bacteroidetes bacterium 4572_117]|nr:MAG: hypothetical protein B6I20_12995 [Bacteroidetes bacterium 4572_117]
MNNSKISIRTSTGSKVIDFKKIMYCIGDGRYTKIFLDNGFSLLNAKTLKSYETILPESSFFRIHKSCLVNLDFIKEFKVNEDRIVILTNNTKLSIAKRRVKLFAQWLYESYPLV